MRLFAKTIDSATAELNQALANLAEAERVHDEECARLMTKANKLEAKVKAAYDRASEQAAHANRSRRVAQKVKDLLS